MAFYVYMLASGKNGTLYIGHTDDLIKRVYQHKHHQVSGFTAQHKVTQLVWFEVHQTRESALTKERQMKKWNRAWKVKRIEADNPQWRDLYASLL